MRDFASDSQERYFSRSCQIRLISVDRESILVVSASLQEVMAAIRSAEDGSLSPMSAGAICEPAEALEEVDRVAKMATVGEERLGACVFRADFSLPGAIAG